jgi:hypothetical protein
VNICAASAQLNQPTGLDRLDRWKPAAASKPVAPAASPQSVRPISSSAWDLSPAAVNEDSRALAYLDRPAAVLDQLWATSDFARFASRRS